MDSCRIGLFSDIHGNLEALKAVLADMEEMGVQDKFCLGDIVGYGPDPAKCLELVRDLGCPILLGNHDEGCVALEPDSSFNTYALAALEHARRQLSDEQKDFLKTLPRKIETDGFTVVHGSLSDKKDWSYVLDVVTRKTISIFRPSQFASAAILISLPLGANSKKQCKDYPLFLRLRLKQMQNI